MRGAPGSRERGNTLVESAIASAVFMIGVLGLLPLFYTSTEGVAVASRLTQATALATSRLEQLVKLPYDAADLAVGDDRHDGANNLNADGTQAPSSTFGAHDGLFYRTISVRETDENAGIAGNDYKIVTVTVTWYDATAKRERSVSVMSGKAMAQ